MTTEKAMTPSITSVSVRVRRDVCKGFLGSAVFIRSTLRPHHESWITLRSAKCRGKRRNERNDNENRSAQEEAGRVKTTNVVKPMGQRLCCDPRADCAQRQGDKNEPKASPNG